MRTQKLVWIGGLLFCLVLVGAIWQRKQGEPRRLCIDAIQNVEVTLNSTNPNKLLDRILLPEAIADRTPAEQVQFIRKPLRDEVKPEGHDFLRCEAQFGPLREIFLEDRHKWGSQAAVNAEWCVAFRLERSDAPSMQIVLAPGSKNAASESSFRVVRCNNITAPAVIQLTTKDQRPDTFALL